MVKPASYEEEFPPLQVRTNEQTRVTTRPYIPATEVTPHGTYKPITPDEEVLNWQLKTLSAITKSYTISTKRIDHLISKMNILLFRLTQLQKKLDAGSLLKAQQLDEDLRRNIDQRYYGPQFQRKEQELSQIKKELRQI
ncbi:hypothetical protein K1719_038079 [Acacia pycnantha]|nr:hypothetical protein K1719_038079 [Acacia pycnantha]